MHQEGYNITAVLFSHQICKTNLITKKHGTNRVRDILQNDWPVLFKSANIMKNQDWGSVQSGGV